MPARFALLPALAIALTLAQAAPALAHGEEEEALRATPARALVQQALALLAQKGDAVEAHERVELALESEDTRRVDMALVRRARRALAAGEHGDAERLLGEALAEPEEMEAEPESQSEPEPGREQAPEHARDGGEARVPAAALDHQGELTPERGTAEWISLAVGILLAMAAATLLLRRRVRGGER